VSGKQTTKSIWKKLLPRNGVIFWAIIRIIYKLNNHFSNFFLLDPLFRSVFYLPTGYTVGVALALVQGPLVPWCDDYRLEKNVLAVSVVNFLARAKFLVFKC
jgi:hypothetical protein